MKERQLRPQDILWNNNKQENRQNNLALADGVFVNGVFRRSLIARRLFRRYQTTAEIMSKYET